jgi:hypothetical protein
LAELADKEIVSMAVVVVAQADMLAQAVLVRQVHSVLYPAPVPAVVEQAVARASTVVALD